MLAPHYSISVLDCNGGLHLLPDHPLEMNVNLRGFVKTLNFAADEIRSRARCAASGVPACAAALTEEVMLRHFIPSFPMLLNYLAPLRAKETLPDECQAHAPGQSNTPIFGRTFWDDSAISTILSNVFNMSSLRISQYWLPPRTCTYERYVLGDAACSLSINEPLTNANFQVGIHQCPNSIVPYISVSCVGPVCDSFMLPCSSTVAGAAAADECDSVATGLSCRALSHFGEDWDMTSWDQFAYFLNNVGLADVFPNGVPDMSELARCDPASGNTPDAEAGALFKLNQIRRKLYSMLNLPFPSFAADGTSRGLGFCMPPFETWGDMKRRIIDSWNEFFEEEVTTNPNTIFGNRPDLDTVACTNQFCDVNWVGDGVCQLECYNSACKFDGGDCGNTAIDQVLWTAQGPQQVHVDRSIPQDCRILPNEAQGLAFSYSNFWEACNGRSRCDEQASPPQCDPNICSACPKVILPSPQPADYGTNPKCRYCARSGQANNLNVVTPPLTGQVRYFTRHLTGIQDRTDVWDPPILASGLNVFDPDRMSGVNFTTPAASFDVGVANLWNWRPLAQLTCAGELGVTAFNGFLQAGFHAPWMADAFAFMGEWVADLVQCRYRSSAGAIANRPLKLFQVETRFMMHHPAFWLYQYTHLGNGFLAGGVPFQSQNQCRGPSCFINTLWDYTRDQNNLVYGSYTFFDPLQVNGFVGEPNPAPLGWNLPGSTQPGGITPDQQASYLSFDANAANGVSFPKFYRFLSPGDGTAGGNPDLGPIIGSSCHWASAAGFGGTGGDLTNQGQIRQRRCSITRKDFVTLFALRGSPTDRSAPGQPLDPFNFHFDMRLDRDDSFASFCAGAATGATDPSAGPTPSYFATPTRTPTMNFVSNGWPLATPTTVNGQPAGPASSWGLPPFSLFHEGPLAEFFSAPRACTTDADCAGRAGLYCTDLDNDLLNLRGIFPGRNVDPMGWFVYGWYNADKATRNLITDAVTAQGCSGPEALGNTVRNFLRVMSGLPRDNSGDSATSLPPRFCFPNTGVLVGQQRDGNTNQNWRVNNVDASECDALLGFDVPERVCINAAPGATALPVPTIYFSGKPARFGRLASNGQTPAAVRLDTVLAPRPEDVGVAPFTPNLVPGTTVGVTGAFIGDFSLSLPALRVVTFNRHMRERVRFALATAYSNLGLPIEPSRVYILSVVDNWGAFLPLQDRVTRAGVVIQYRLEFPDDRGQAFTLNITGRITTPLFQLQLASQIVELGIVPQRYIGGITSSLQQGCVGPGCFLPANAGPVVAGVILGLGIPFAIGWYWFFGSFCGVTIGMVAGWVRALLGMPDNSYKRGVGEVVPKVQPAAAKQAAPPRKMTIVEGSANPMTTATAVAAVGIARPLPPLPAAAPVAAKPPAVPAPAVGGAAPAAVFVAPSGAVPSGSTAVSVMRAGRRDGTSDVPAATAAAAVALAQQPTAAPGVPVPVPAPPPAKPV
jgi:hypothetical protein